MPGQNGHKRRKTAENCEPGGTLPADDWSNRKQHCYANPMHKRIFFVFIAILAASAVMAQAYRWVDEDGVVHYGDRPPPDAETQTEAIVLPEANVTSVRKYERPAAESSSSDEANETAGAFRYESLEIATPAAEETLWNIAGNLDVSLSVTPAIQQGHRVRVYFDGEERVLLETRFSIDEVWRGVHNIQVEIIDETGKLMIRSKTNRFYVQQNRIGG